MAKTATFGVMHVATSFTVTYALTGNVAVAGAVTFVEPAVNTVMHYFFDKYWDRKKAHARTHVDLQARTRATEAIHPGAARA
jgi:uncharacterized membrane protein